MRAIPAASAMLATMNIAARLLRGPNAGGGGMKDQCQALIETRRAPFMSPSSILSSTFMMTEPSGPVVQKRPIKPALQSVATWSRFFVYDHDRDHDHVRDCKARVFRSDRFRP